MTFLERLVELNNLPVKIPGGVDPNLLLRSSHFNDGNPSEYWTTIPSRNDLLGNWGQKGIEG
jgi:hypothetical protein